MFQRGNTYGVSGETDMSYHAGAWELGNIHLLHLTDLIFIRIIYIF